MRKTFISAGVAMLLLTFVQGRAAPPPAKPGPELLKDLHSGDAAARAQALKTLLILRDADDGTRLQTLLALARFGSEETRRATLPGLVKALRGVWGLVPHPNTSPRALISMMRLAEWEKQHAISVILQGGVFVNRNNPADLATLRALGYTGREGDGTFSHAAYMPFYVDAYLRDAGSAWAADRLGVLPLGGLPVFAVPQVIFPPAGNVPPVRDPTSFARVMTLDLLVRELALADEPVLKEKLKDVRPEVRLAAVLVVAIRRLPLGEELIDLVERDHTEISQAARWALIGLGTELELRRAAVQGLKRPAALTDFGPVPNAAPAAKAEAVRAWRDWWARHQAEFPRNDPDAEGPGR